MSFNESCNELGIEKGSHDWYVAKEFWNLGIVVSMEKLQELNVDSALSDLIE